MQAQQTEYPVPAHCMHRATLPCFHQNCPEALYSQQNLPAAQMAALRVSVTGPLEVLHTSGVASLSAHTPTYRMAAQECIRRLPSFAPASISLLTLLCAAQISYHFSSADRVKSRMGQMTPETGCHLPSHSNCQAVQTQCVP